MGKLIRNKLENKILTNNKDAKFIKLTKEQLEIELETKLLEEVNEFRNATSIEDKTEEMADILEVIETFYKLGTINEKNVLEVKSKKNEDRGGFFEGTYWKG